MFFKGLNECRKYFFVSSCGISIKDFQRFGPPFPSTSEDSPPFPNMAQPTWWLGISKLHAEHTKLFPDPISHIAKVRSPISRHPKSNISLTYFCVNFVSEHMHRSATCIWRRFCSLFGISRFLAFRAFRYYKQQIESHLLCKGPRWRRTYLNIALYHQWR